MPQAFSQGCGGQPTRVFSSCEAARHAAQAQLCAAYNLGWVARLRAARKEGRPGQASVATVTNLGSLVFAIYLVGGSFFSREIKGF